MRVRGRYSCGTLADRACGPLSCLVGQGVAEQRIQVVEAARRETEVAVMHERVATALERRRHPTVSREAPRLGRGR